MFRVFASCSLVATMSCPGAMAVCILLASQAAARADDPVILRMVVEPHAQGGLKARFLADREPDSPGVIRLCLCPPGQAVVGDPRGPDGKTPKMEKVSKGVVDVKQPFFLSQREIAQDLYFSVLEHGSAPEAEWKRLLEQWTGPPPETGATKPARRIKRAEYGDESDSFKEPTDLPMFDVSIEEAVFFCKTLTEIYERDAGKGGLVSYRFRLPTHVEWQYACRACKDVNQFNEKKWPHFNQSPSEDAWKKDPVFKNLWEVIKNANPRADLPESVQDQMLWLLRPFSDTDPRKNTEYEAKTRQFLLGDMILKEGLGLEYDLEASIPGKLHKPGESKTRANNWKIYDMHGGVSEWVISGREDWDRLLQRTPGVGPLLTAGGDYNRQVKKDEWQEFTIWGARKWDYTAATTPGSTLARKVGIRLLVETIPSRNVPQLLRKALLADAIRSPDDVRKSKERLESDIQTLRQLAPEEAAKVDSLFDYYTGLAYRKVGAGAEAETALARSRDRAASSKVAGEKKTLLDTVSYLVPRDRKARK